MYGPFPKRSVRGTDPTQKYYLEVKTRFLLGLLLAAGFFIVFFVSVL